MPAYNTELYIAEAIQSCIDQTYNMWELIIWDDGSTDNTLEIARSYNDERIIVGSGEHAGCPNANNSCLTLCCGEMIARMGSDDLQHPTRIEKSVDMLLKNPESPLVSCKMQYLKGDKLSPAINGKMKPRLYWKGDHSGAPVNASIVTMKEVYDKVGWYDEGFKVASDGDWNFRTLKYYDNWQFIDEYLYTYRRHSSQITQRRTAEAVSNHQKSLIANRPMSRGEV